MRKVGLLFLLNILTITIVSAQYYQAPLNIPIQLAANFGELRTNHYHMGLDIRTQQRENLPVYAVADGYISRVYISPYGYGNMLIVTHPNGYTTLYAHLNSFLDTLANYVKAKQNKDRSWAQNFYLQPNEFPVKKGQQIALSGNTGGSEGPHVHFEIRDTKTDRQQNPLAVQPFVSDNIKPMLYHMYWYDRRFSTYQTTPKSIPIKLANGKYTSVNTTTKVGSPIISFGFSGEDKTSAQSFKFGIYKATLKLDEKTIFSFTLNNFSNEESRYVNAGIDYKHKYTVGGYIQHLSILPGNKLNIFSGGNGMIMLQDTLPHDIELTLEDPAGNASLFTTQVQLSDKLDDIPVSSDAYTVVPNRGATLTSEHAELTYSDVAFYDFTPFQMKEINTNIPSRISNTIALGKYYIPIHDYYKIAIDWNPIVDNSYKRYAVMELVSNGSRYFSKGTWIGNRFAGKFNRLGDVRIVLDSVAPIIRTMGWNNGSTFIRQKNIVVRLSDQLSGVDRFDGYLDGKWMLFSQRGSTYTYEIDSSLSDGNHEILLQATDLAGNTVEQKYSIIKQ